MTPIYKIQGRTALSPFAGEKITTRGVITGYSHHGFFLQDTNTTLDPPSDAVGCSHAIFVFYRGKNPPLGCEIEIDAKVVDYVKGEERVDKPVTQLHWDNVRLVNKSAQLPPPIVLSAEWLLKASGNLKQALNAFESMLFTIEAGATFLQPSNAFADYVVEPKELVMSDYCPGVLKAKHGGYVFPADSSKRWLPGFRILDVEEAPKVNVGDILESDITGPLYFRSNAYQISTTSSFQVLRKKLFSATRFSREEVSGDSMTVMTVNCLNLDPKLEDADRVLNARSDIDDDIGSGQFAKLAIDIVNRAESPDILALQEIQDSDGAEQTKVTSAETTYRCLVKAIELAGGPVYDWVDKPPMLDQDGGQPGGNIRNGYLYRPDQVSLIESSVERLFGDASAFESSRKPLLAGFKRSDSAAELFIINIHLASKRHQHSIFAQEKPGYDPKDVVRQKQAQLLYDKSRELLEAGRQFYITGDFNDLTDSETLEVFKGKFNINLVETLDEGDRFDYNHRGQLHALTHGIVDKDLVAQQLVTYSVLHGNELLGQRPGVLSGKASDHAYVIVEMKLTM